jgi:tetratricopeptide (TPR) repeat protein
LAGLSWVLATTNKDEFRNGAEAFGLAERACELTDYRNPEALRTLAAAYAETGQFIEAVEAAQKAVNLYLASGDQRRAAHTARMQQLYKGGRPYRANQ